MNKKLILCIFAAVLLGLMPVMAADNGTLSIDPVTIKSGDPGQSITIDIVVNNNDLVNDMSVTLSSTALACISSGCGSSTISAPSISDVDNILAMGKKAHTFSISIPSTYKGSYEATLSAVDKVNPDNKFSINYKIIVNSKQAMSVSPATLSFYLEAGEASGQAVTITNTGSEDLSTFNFTYTGDTEDGDGDDIAVTATFPASIAPGASADAVISLDLDSGLDVGEYSGTGKITSGSLSSNVAIALEVMPKMCRDGVVGDLEVRIKEPDNGDSFEAGERINIEVGVDNNYKKSMYVIVEAYLYDEDEDDIVKTVKSASQRISSNDDDNFDLELVVPYSGMDDEHKYYLYAMAYKSGDEDEHCNFARIELELEPIEDMVAITDFRITPSTAKPGDNVQASVTVENLGEDIQESVYIMVSDFDLKWMEESDTFELEKYGDSDDDNTETFRLKIPEDAEAKTYYVHATVYYDGGDRTESFALTVESDETADEADEEEEVPEENAVIELEVDSPIMLSEGQLKFTIPVKLSNKGSSEAKVNLDVTEYSAWADVIGIESPETIFPNEDYHIYIYMTLKEDVEESTHNLRVNVREGARLVDSEIVAVEIAAGEEEDSGEKSGISGWIAGKIENKKLFWIMADVVLVIVALLFLRALFKK
ncbi:MAG: putative S-layer protein [Candidatus Woesearchaeota archaeon]